MRRHFYSVVFVLFFITGMFSSLFAQEDDSNWYWGHPVTKIEFDGLKNVKKSDLTGVTSSFLGQPFSEDLLGEIFDRLFSLDLF